jgi:hypothetical protein
MSKSRKILNRFGSSMTFSVPVSAFPSLYTMIWKRHMEGGDFNREIPEIHELILSHKRRNFKMLYLCVVLRLKNSVHSMNSVKVPRSHQILIFPNKIAIFWSRLPFTFLYIKKMCVTRLRLASMVCLDADQRLIESLQDSEILIGSLYPA